MLATDDSWILISKLSMGISKSCQFTRKVWDSMGGAESYNVSVSCVGSPCNRQGLFNVPAPQSQKNLSCRINSTTCPSWHVLIQFKQMAFLSVVWHVLHLQVQNKTSDEPQHDKTNKMSVRPAKTPTSLCIRPVWSESSLRAQWVAKGPKFLHADSDDWSDWADAQADLSLRWAHTHFVGFVMSQLRWCMTKPTKLTWAPSEDSDQRGHPSVWSFLAVRCNRVWTLATHKAISKDSESGWVYAIILLLRWQPRPDKQADLNPHWAHTVDFALPQLIQMQKNELLFIGCLFNLIQVLWAYVGYFKHLARGFDSGKQTRNSYRNSA